MSLEGTSIAGRRQTEALVHSRAGEAFANVRRQRAIVAGVRSPWKSRVQGDPTFCECMTRGAARVYRIRAVIEGLVIARRHPCRGPSPQTDGRETPATARRGRLDSRHGHGPDGRAPFSALPSPRRELRRAAAADGLIRTSRTSQHPVTGVVPERVEAVHLHASEYASQDAKQRVVSEEGRRRASNEHRVVGQEYLDSLARVGPALIMARRPHRRTATARWCARIAARVADTTGWPSATPRHRSPATRSR